MQKGSGGGGGGGGGNGNGNSSGQIPLPGTDPNALNLIPTGTVLLTRLANEREIVLEQDKLGEAALQGAVFFETMTPIQPHPLRNSICLYDWGGAVECLHPGDTTATLAIDYALLSTVMRTGDVVILEAMDDSNGAQADSTLRHAVSITRMSPVVDRINTDSGVPRLLTEIEWHEEDALPFSLQLRYPGGAPAAHVCANVVLADHGRTIANEPLIPEVPPEGERYRPRLARTDLTHSEPIEFTRWRKYSASSQLRQDPRRAIPRVVIHEERVDTGRTLPWSPRRDLLASGAFDRHVVVEVENDHTAHIRFGDGMYGRIPSNASERSWSATYRVGSGAEGNIGASALAHLVVPDVSETTATTIRTGIIRVYNPLPAVGGNRPERDEQARLYAPYAFRVGERAVTSDDYAKIVERHPEVQKAVADIRWTGSWNTVFVAVDRQGGRYLDLAFEAELRTFLEPYRMAGQDLEFQPPNSVALDVAFTVHVQPEHVQSEVRAALVTTLGSGQMADGTRGFFHPDNFSFGDPVYLSHLITRAMEVPGVAWLDVSDEPPRPNRFQRYGEPSRGELGAGVIRVGPMEIVRLDNDPRAPHNGRLRLFMKGGL